MSFLWVLPITRITSMPVSSAADGSPRRFKSHFLMPTKSATAKALSQRCATGPGIDHRGDCIAFERHVASGSAGNLDGRETYGFQSTGRRRSVATAGLV